MPGEPRPTDHLRLAAIPAIDRLLALPAMRALATEHGHELVAGALRESTEDLRRELHAQAHAELPPDLEGFLCEAAARRVAKLVAPTLRRVVNLTGTVLHTNLGRAPLPAEAIEAMREAAGAVNVEMTLSSGRRGERDDHVERWLCRLTGAEAATVVNNNAAAVLLVLNTLASRREVPVSRGELIEIGGAFRMPEIMKRAGVKLVEVGTTNRTHPRDFQEAVGPRTGALMKVHTSNYAVCGFTASVGERELAAIAHAHDLPCIDDLGSGSLIDLTSFGLPSEPTPQGAIADGVDVVTFSGDKLLGGPQCGIVVGRKRLVERIRRNPMKRALRLDKITIAALAAVLRLYADPSRVVERVPGLRQLARDQASIRAAAERVAAAIAAALGARAEVTVVECDSQVGSGALPLTRLPSAGVAVRPPGRTSGRRAERLARAFRALPVPVIGRIRDDALVLDLRCLEDESELLAQLPHLGI
jgi:L-seryl-tRNA(Ser) seleniumtransferase